MSPNRIIHNESDSVTSHAFPGVLMSDDKKHFILSAFKIAIGGVGGLFAMLLVVLTPGLPDEVLVGIISIISAFIGVKGMISGPVKADT